MKKIAILLAAALFFCALATAEAVTAQGFALTLPEGFAVVPATDMEGYREAAARDACAAYGGEVLLATREGAAISVVTAATAYADAHGAAEALVAEYANYVAGFESVEPQYFTAGGREFARVQVSMDGQVASQYLLVEGGTLYALTFVGVADEEALSVLEGFVPGTPATPTPPAPAQTGAPAPIPGTPAPSPAA